MIKWYWLLVAFYAGVFTGIFTIAMCLAAKRGDAHLEREEYHVQKAAEAPGKSPQI